MDCRELEKKLENATARLKDIQEAKDAKIEAARQAERDAKRLSGEAQLLWRHEKDIKMEISGLQDELEYDRAADSAHWEELCEKE